MADNDPIGDINDALSLANDLAQTVQNAVVGLIGAVPRPPSGAASSAGISADHPTGLLTNIAARARDTRGAMMVAMQELHRLGVTTGDIMPLDEPRSTGLGSLLPRGY